jgi:hypothetical protein
MNDATALKMRADTGRIGSAKTPSQERKKRGTPEVSMTYTGGGEGVCHPPNEKYFGSCLPVIQALA